MRRTLIALGLLSSTVLLASCGVNQAGCTSGCGYVARTTTTYVPTPTYIPANRYKSNCCYTANCCPTCDRCGSAYGYDAGYYGYDSGYSSGSGYGYNNTGWY